MVKAGDIVRLAGHKRIMTVESVSGDRVSCAWFHGGTMHRETFDVRLLIPKEGKK